MSKNSRPATGYRPLIAEHEIISLPSASTLAVLREELAGRRPADKLVAVLADPVFQTGDPRVRNQVSGLKDQGRINTRSTEPIPDLERSAREVGILDFERLPFTRREAEAIIAQAQTGKSFKAIDFDASRATVSNAGLDQYRIVHFATHGIFNSQHPELSGLVLSLVDEKGVLQNGFLQIHDIYNMKLGAELVVLSACSTALGKEIKGEGLVGFVRGFMYAGARSVVASVWNVRDAATAELMKRFYEGMLKEHLSPSAALRRAQVSMWQDRRWEAPFYWAGFIIQGD